MSARGVGKLHTVGAIQPLVYFIVKTVHFRRGGGRGEEGRKRGKERKRRKRRRRETETSYNARNTYFWALKKMFANLWSLIYNRKQVSASCY